MFRLLLNFVAIVCIFAGAILLWAVISTGMPFWIMLFYGSCPALMLYCGCKLLRLLGP